MVTDWMPQMVVVFGDSRRPEFVPVVAALESLVRRLPKYRLRGVRMLFDDFDLADRLSRDVAGEKIGGEDFFSRPEIPVLAFFLESYPGEFLPGMFARLRRDFPLMPQILVAGTLCDGGGRTETIPPGVIRFPVARWEPFGRRETERFLTGAAGRFSLPLTAIDEDYFREIFRADEESGGDRLTAAPLPDLIPIFHSSLSAHSTEKLPTVCVVSPADGGMERLFLESARENGVEAGGFDWETLCVAAKRSVAGPSRLIIDSVEPDTAEWAEKIAELAGYWPDMITDILIFSPRVEEVTLLEAVPGCRVLAKPFEMSSLF